MNYEAVSDKTTIVNPTQHSYFNLSVDLKNDILDHELVINVDSFLPVNSKLIPTGEFKDVKETLFDFRNPKLIQKDRGWRWTIKKWKRLWSLLDFEQSKRGF